MPLHETLATAFAALSLAPEMVEHPPLRTVPDAHEFWDALPGLGVTHRRPRRPAAPAGHGCRRSGSAARAAGVQQRRRH